MARRKELYLEKHPEAGRGGDRRSIKRKQMPFENDEPADGFAVATAAAIGRNERVVRLDVQRGTEIAENLHRADLTTLQRNEQVAEWIVLTEADGTNKPAQVAPVSKGGRGNKAGINAASRELGIERTEAQRAVKIAGISAAGKEAARSAGLDNNQTALLKVAAVEDERQVAVVQEIVAARPAARTQTSPADPATPFRLWIEEGQRWLNSGAAAWSRVIRSGGVQTAQLDPTPRCWPDRGRHDRYEPAHRRLPGPGD